MKYRQIVISLLIGLILGLSTNAFAAVGDTVQSVFAQFNYVVNGSAQPTVPALVYEGTSYMRTTDIANMLGYDVTYKADSRTIEFNGGTQTPLSTPSPSPAATPVTVTGDTYGTTPVPSVIAIPTPTPDPNATPAPSATPGPSVAPSATPAPTVEPTPAPTPYVGPTNEHVQFCQQYRMDPDVAAAHGC